MIRTFGRMAESRTLGKFWCQMPVIDAVAKRHGGRPELLGLRRLRLRALDRNKCRDRIGHRQGP